MCPFNPQLSVLPDAQRKFWPQLQQFKEKFVLYGGTAISLRYGHRVSVDFDLFSHHSFEPADLNQEIIDKGNPVQAASNNYSFFLETNPQPVKISLFGNLKMGRVSEPELPEDGVIHVASPLDLLASKLKVVFQRAEKKDYQDIATLVENGPELAQGLGAARTLYGENFNPALALKSLTFFEDGDLCELDSEIKESLKTAVKNCQNLPAVEKKTHSLVP